MKSSALGRRSVAMWAVTGPLSCRRVVGRMLGSSKLEVAGNAFEQLVGRREIALATGDQVFEAAAERCARGVATQLQHVGAAVRVLGFRIQDHGNVGSDWIGVSLGRSHGRVVSERSMFGRDRAAASRKTSTTQARRNADLSLTTAMARVPSIDSITTAHSHRGPGI